MMVAPEIPDTVRASDDVAFARFLAETGLEECRATDAGAVPWFDHIVVPFGRDGRQDYRFQRWVR